MDDGVSVSVLAQGVYPNTLLYLRGRGAVIPLTVPYPRRFISFAFSLQA